LSEDFAEELKKDFGFNPKIPFLRMPKKEIQGEYAFKFSVEDMIVQPKEVQFQQWTNFMGMIFQAGEYGTQALQEEGVSLKNVVKKIAELGGVDLNSVKETGPAQIPVEKENQMFLNGMEVPEPHKRDQHDEHNLGHGRALREFETRVASLQGEMQSRMQQAEQLQMMGANPQLAGQVQQLQQALQENMGGLQDELDQVAMIARRIKIHMQKHEERRIQKEGASAGGGGGQMAAPQDALAQQVNIRSNSIGG
jgi:hypothetical protein